MNINKYLGWVVVGFMALLYIQTCGNNRAIQKLNLENQKLISIINKRGDTIKQQEAIIVKDKEVLNNLTDTIFNLKRKRSENTVVYVKGVTETRLVKVNVPFTDSSRINFVKDSISRICKEISSFIKDSTLIVPAKVELKDPNFSMEGVVTSSGLKIDTLSIPDTLQLRFVEKKGTIFRKPSIKVQYFHTNPLIKDISSNSVFYKPKRKSFFQRVILPVAIGVGVGILINK